VRIAVVGSGYVGLVTGACFAEMGNDVVCVDKDAAKIARLRAGEIPIYEPGLATLIQHGTATGLLGFSASLAESIARAEYIFIAVGTPPAADGVADLSSVEAVAAEIGDHLSSYAVVIDKSTVPVGTGDMVRKTIAAALARRGAKLAFDVVSNPEFLKEGSAVSDFRRPDRIVIGADSEDARRRMLKLYSPFVRNHDRVLFMSVRDAEMTKYAANAMLATRISFMNEIANLCDRLGVDVENVRKGIGSDARIGYSFIYPGCGYGGSCFPKDISALIHSGREADFDLALLRAVEDRNQRQKRLLFEMISDHFGSVRGRHFAVWGLAFKPNTDDVREATSLVLIRQLIEAGATVAAHDPVAIESAGREVDPAWIADGRLRFSARQYEALEGADALVLVTEWKQFRQPDFDLIVEKLRSPVIFDGRNQYEPDHMDESGIQYYGIGRSGRLAKPEGTA